jgi:large subunit ribosomal protein L21
MKTYADNPDYQGLVTAFEKAKSAYQEAKNQKKEVRSFFKSAKKKAENKASVHAAHLKYRQAKLEQKFEALTARAAELDLQEFVHAFTQQQKSVVKATKKADTAKKVKAKNGAGNSANIVEKPVSKAGKSKETVKVSKPVVESKEATKSTKKAAKKVAHEAKVAAKSGTQVATETVTKVATKVAKPVVVETKKATKETDKVVEKPVVKVEKVVVTKPAVAKPLTKTEVPVVSKTTTNDLTVIEGIGPKIAQILAQNEVKNFKSLIATPVEDIKTWLKDNKLAFIDPTTWAEQAQLVDAGKLVEFETLKQQLKGGKRT